MAWHMPAVEVPGRALPPAVSALHLHQNRKETLLLSGDEATSPAEAFVLLLNLPKHLQTAGRARIGHWRWLQDPLIS